MITNGNERPFRKPNREEVRQLADELGFPIDEEAMDTFAALVVQSVKGIGGIRTPPDTSSALAPDEIRGRSSGYRPEPSEDPDNAWLTKCRVTGATGGPLDGMTVGIKDSIALAGYELTAGSRVLEGFVPRIDATVVSRLLDAGATITGKLNMESFAMSGRGDFSDFGPVVNPHDDGHLAGGSSGGSGAAVARGDCDLSLGTDQAGSIRIPSSWCGVVGLKPTHGLVPYTGILPLERSVDHVGPIARSTDLVARAMEVLAGVDTIDGIPIDPRQPPTIETESYTDAIDAAVSDLSIGILEEGFGLDLSDPKVDEAVRAAADVFEAMDIPVESVSVPAQARGLPVFGGISVQGVESLLFDRGVGTNHRGWAWPHLARTLDAFLDARAGDLPPMTKARLLAARFLREEYGLEPYAKAREAVISMRQEFDQALATHDALLLPTTVTRAQPMEPETPPLERISGETRTIRNTCATNLTGHPALSIPCAKPDGLPVGAMLIGRHFEEQTLLALGSAFERETNWKAR